MSIRGYNTKQINQSQYSQQQIKSILQELGIRIAGETSSEFSFYCPFHSNTHSASCSINKESGAWICFNPSCGESGTLLEIVKRLSDKNDFQAIRFISTKESEVLDKFDEFINEILADKPEFDAFPQDKLNDLYNELGGSEEAKQYFISRGISEESMHYFKLGYSAKQGMVTVPIHSPDGTPVGIVGRSITDKRFKNSTNLPRRKTMFNIHRAKRVGDQVIVVESSFDAIRIHQAGFPNVVATLGGHISPENLSLLNKYFNTITIMTDADVAGRDLGSHISNKLRMKNILWASCEYGKIYPNSAKDAGDMTDEEIKACIKNAVSDIEYRSWK
ncbi:MAG: toprim domain-containing protein [Candidatus Nanopelagicaceae bacterium]